MNAENAMTLINNGLFPILVCIGLAFFIWKQQTETNKILTDLQMTIVKLTTLIDEKLD